MLSDFKESEHPYYEFDAPKILTQLIDEGLIELLELKHHEKN